MNIKERYIYILAESIWKTNHDFFMRYAPGSVVQFVDPNAKFSSIEDKKPYLDAANKIIYDIAPPIIFAVKNDPDSCEKNL